MILAVGLGLDRDTGVVSERHGLVLREETLALLWSCLLTRTSCEPLPGSRLYHLPCHWGPAEGDIPETDEAEAAPFGLQAILRPLDRLHLIMPEGASAFAIGDNEDDAVWYVGLVGREEQTWEQHAYFLREDWLESLWQTLLFGPGAHFAAERSPYREIFEGMSPGHP
jgi:hypothetical protein